MATKIGLKNLSPEVLAMLGGGGALSHDILSNVTVGAAPAGTKFPLGQDLTSFAENILVKAVGPTISTTFSGTGTYEVGNSVNGTKMQLTITNLSSISSTYILNKIDFYINNNLVNSQPFVDGTSTYQFTDQNPIISNTNLKAVLTYNSNKTLEGSGSIIFEYGSFVGVTNFDTITETIAESFIDTFNKTIKTGKGYTWNNITVNDQRFCYMYPAKMGALSSIKDGNGFEQLGSYTKYDITVTYPTDNKEVPYYIYLLTDATTGSGFKQIYV